MRGAHPAWPAIMPSSSSISTGLVKPNSRIEVAICATVLVVVHARVSGAGDQRRAPAPNNRLGLGAPSASTGAKPHDAAERRQLTVMFCDLVGSTALSTQKMVSGSTVSPLAPLPPSSGELGECVAAALCRNLHRGVRRQPLHVREPFSGRQGPMQLSSIVQRIQPAGERSFGVGKK
jgi:hypothetical protein